MSKFVVHREACMSGAEHNRYMMKSRSTVVETFYIFYCELSYSVQTSLPSSPNVEFHTAPYLSKIIRAGTAEKYSQTVKNEQGFVLIGLLANI